MKRIIALALAGCMLSLSGCITSVRLNNRGIVEAVAIDMSPVGEYLVTMQVVEAVASAAGANQPGDSTKPVLVTAEGSTMTGLLTEAAAVEGKQLFLGSIQIILVGEDAAREGLAELLTFFNASNQTLPTVPLVVTRGPAGDLLKAKEQNASLSAGGILDSIKSSEKIGFAPRSRMMDLIGAAEEGNGSGMLAYIGLKEPEQEEESSSGGEQPVEPTDSGTPDEGGSSSKEEKQAGKKEQPQQPVKIDVLGTAVFQQDRLRATIGRRETRGLQWLSNRMSNSSVTVQDDKLGKVALVTHRQRARIKPERIGDNLVFDIAVSINSTAYEVRLAEGGKMDQLRRTYAADLQAREIRAEIEAAIAATQQRGYDVLELSMVMKQQDPGFFAENSGRWAEVVATAGYNVEVRCEIDRSGSGNLTDSI